MAKRKRLSPADPGMLEPVSAPETKALSRPPIADVAGDAASAAALRDLAAEITGAETEGRLVMRLRLDQIETGYLMRDRIAVTGEDEEMEALIASIVTRGQQSPIDVVALEDGRFGLISGWRRCEAIRRLAAQGQGPGEVLALQRRPDGLGEAYCAMVEENEIRAGLSYYERARIAARAVEAGIYTSHKSALQSLFSTASRAKRSKIKSFLTIVSALDDILRFPQALPERLGLHMAKGLKEDPLLGSRISNALKEQPPEDATQEQKIIARVMQDASGAVAAKAPAKPYAERELRPGVMVRVHNKEGRVELWGEGLTPRLRGQLLSWLERLN